MNKVLICLIIFLILSFSFYSEKMVDYNDISDCVVREISEDDEEFRRPLINKGSLNIGTSCTKKSGDINTNGEILTKQICIQVPESSENKCLNFHDIKKIKNGPHHHKKRICIDSYDAEVYKNPTTEVCLTDDHIKYLRNLRSNLSKKKYEMREKFINSKPRCNWHGERFFCGDWTGIGDDYIIGCFAGKVQYMKLGTWPYAINRNWWGGMQRGSEFTAYDFDNNGKYIGR